MPNDNKNEKRAEERKTKLMNVKKAKYFVEHANFYK